MMAGEIILGQKETFLRRKQSFSSEEKLPPSEEKATTYVAVGHRLRMY